MKEFPKDLITQSEAARLRGVSPEAIADLIRRGRLDTYEVAGRLHVRRSDIQKFKAQPGGRPPKTEKK
ncbi:MAG: helix-turn-helix domain-containing protein [Pyrinomonadaceae bacterium]|nr:helix-turn-helix domain-containing protein [Pyrinomonadaceae bacterium]